MDSPFHVTMNLKPIVIQHFHPIMEFPRGCNSAKVQKSTWRGAGQRVTFGNITLTKWIFASVKVADFGV